MFGSACQHGDPVRRPVTALLLKSSTSLTSLARSFAMPCAGDVGDVMDVEGSIPELAALHAKSKPF